YCNDCRDIDLCRDRALLAQEWRCAVPQCGQPYDRGVMENALLQIVRQRERLYHLQDLVCHKCNQVKAAHLAEHCACAGSFRCKEGVSEFWNKMQGTLFVLIQSDHQNQTHQHKEKLMIWEVVIIHHDLKPFVMGRVLMNLRSLFDDRKFA
ncbi:unnamed protein product, partial [Ilex paraguariensis]